MTERLLTAREVGELLGLSTESVLRRWRAGEIPAFDWRPTSCASTVRR